MKIQKYIWMEQIKKNNFNYLKNNYWVFKFI